MEISGLGLIQYPAIYFDVLTNRTRNLSIYEYEAGVQDIRLRYHGVMCFVYIVVYC